MIKPAVLTVICTLCIIFTIFVNVNNVLAFLSKETNIVSNTFIIGDYTYVLILDSNPPEGHDDQEVEMPFDLSSKTEEALSVIFTTDNDPTLEGYIFDGWYTKSVGGERRCAPGENSIKIEYGDPEDSNSLIDEINITLYAQWKPVSYTVTYDANGGEGVTDASTHKFDEESALTENAFTRDGYAFIGWSTDSSATDPEFEDKESVLNLTSTEGDTVTLFAVWKQMDFTLSFDTCVDGVTNPEDKIVTFEEEYGELPVVSRVGYTFVGWTLTENGTDYVNSTTTVSIAADHTLYAQWAAKSYTIRYHANTGTGTMADHNIEYDIPTSLYKNTFTKNDYTFAGWALTPDGEVKFIDEQTVTNLLESGVLDLYAVWVQNSHSVAFDYNGGTGSPRSKQVFDGKEYGVLPTYPMKDEHLFLGWYTEKDGGTRVTPSTIVNSTEDHTLYAHWIYSAANDIIKNLEIRNNPDDNNDGVVDDIYLRFSCSSYYEKFNVPIENLVVGQRYKLTFTESNNAKFGTVESGYSPAFYGCVITPSETLNQNSIKTEAIADGGLIAQWSDRTKGDDWLHGPREWTMEFVAEATTMYWTWDMGLIQDGTIYDYNFRNIKLVPIVPEIKFANKTVIHPAGFSPKITSDKSSQYSTTFVFDGESGCELVYFPITGLTVGTTYTITFNHTFTGALIDNTKYEYGCGIYCGDPAKLAATGFMSGVTTSWASGTHVDTTVTGTAHSVTLTFKATATTAYWVWNMANSSDSIPGTTEVQVTSFSAKHSGGGNIVYYSKSQ